MTVETRLHGFLPLVADPDRPGAVMFATGPVGTQALTRADQLPDCEMDLWVFRTGEEMARHRATLEGPGNNAVSFIQAARTFTSLPLLLVFRHDAPRRPGETPNEVVELHNPDTGASRLLAPIPSKADWTRVDYGPSGTSGTFSIMYEAKTPDGTWTAWHAGTVDLEPDLRAELEATVARLGLVWASEGILAAAPTPNALDARSQAYIADHALYYLLNRLRIENDARVELRALARKADVKRMLRNLTAGRLIFWSPRSKKYRHAFQADPARMTAQKVSSDMVGRLVRLGVLRVVWDRDRDQPPPWNTTPGMLVGMLPEGRAFLEGDVLPAAAKAKEAARLKPFPGGPVGGLREAVDFMRPEFADADLAAMAEDLPIMKGQSLDALIRTNPAEDAWTLVATGLLTQSWAITPGGRIRTVPRPGERPMKPRSR